MGIKFDGTKVKDGSGAMGIMSGNKLREGAGSRALISTKDAAKAIGATSEGPLTALVW